MIEFLHPSVTTKITDNSMTFVTAQGLTQLFVAFTSDKGVDNKIKRISSPSEWFFHYGEPNMRKHGQAAYNAVNWLNAGGGVYALRVTPEDAGFAHGILNIQTREGFKSIRDEDDGLISVPNVELRHTVTYTPINNTSNDLLKNELTRQDTAKTIDGYTNNPLLVVLPKGRGRAYNNLGFRIRLNTVYDETYKFRLYDFEVTETSESGAVNVIDGPYLVSLYPEAISNSHESLFIEDVINKYSEYVTVMFNETAYDALTELINPDVDPAVLDVISAQSRIIEGKQETFFSDETGMDLNTHYKIDEYTEEGIYTGNKNIATVENLTHRNVLDIDYNLRLDQYKTQSKRVENQLLGFSRFRKNPESFFKEVEKIIKVNEENEIIGGTVKETLDKLKVTTDEFDELVEEAIENPDDIDDITVITAKASMQIDIYKRLVADLKKALDYSLTLVNDEKTLNAESELFVIETFLAQHRIDSIKLSTFLSDAVTNMELVNDLKVSTKPNKNQKINTSRDLLEACGNMLDTSRTMSREDIGLSKDKIDACEVTYKEAYELYDYATDEYILDDEMEDTLNSLISKLESAYLQLTGIYRLLQIESLINLNSLIEPVVPPVTMAVTLAVNTLRLEIDSIDSDKAKEILEDQFKHSIDNANANLVTTKDKIYIIKLQDMRAYIQFSGGTDGSLEDENVSRRNQLISRLLVNAYRGNVDETIRNTKDIRIDIILDGNHPIEVKNAMHQLSSEIRKDCMTFLDTGFQATPEQVLSIRSNLLQMSSVYTALYSQDFIVHDEYTGRDIRVTTPFFLASMIPSLDKSPGLSYPLAGPRRGTLSGFKKLSFNPQPAWKEELYRRQINYVEQEPARTNIATQLTTQTKVTALSQINNVRTLLQIVREVQDLSSIFRLEFNDDQTIQSFQETLNILLDKWRNNRACKKITGTVYASEYDRDQGIIRVRISISFTSITERILIEFNVEK